MTRSTTTAPLRRRVPLGTAVAILAALDPAGAQRTPGSGADWRVGATCYEIFVRSFQDSDGDGVGDLEGLIRKLDYVNDGDRETETDLGARCVWLMPIAASPSYHGYDVTDYYRVDPAYGTNDDFRRLVREAKRRGVRVLVDMVINHTSSEHPYFKHALLHADSPYRPWYRWSDERGGPNEWGGFNWHASPYRDEYYYGFFWSGMPDLNWEDPAVRREMEAVAAFWLRDMGADGFRLDAVRHLMEDGERTANAPATHEALREYAAHVRAVAPGSFTIGEVFDSTDVLRAYYPDQLDAYFGFEVANAILDAVRSGSAARLLAAVPEMRSVAPDTRWSPFLRNHDQTRTMTWLEGDMARSKLAASLLLTLPGLPFVYYGEEIGMTGDKPDPRLRTPMHWSLAPAAGFTTGVPWEPLQPDSLTANVAVMEKDPASLLNHYRRLVHLRDRTPELGAGDFLPLDAGADGVAAWLRRTGGSAGLVVANLTERELRGVALSAGPGALPPGRHRGVNLLGGGAAGPIEVRPDGSFQAYRPLPVLAPLTAYVLRIGGGG